MNQYFSPLPRENLPISPCDPSLYYPDEGDAHPILWPRRPRQISSEYVEGRRLAAIISRHLYEIAKRLPRKWNEIG